MVRTENLVTSSSTCWSRAKARSGPWGAIVGWVMSNVNEDMHTAAVEQNLDLLREIAEYGCWSECTIADDPEGNTALHKAVLACTEYSVYVSEAKRLKIKKNKETDDYTERSGWRKHCQSKYQVEKLKDEVQDWRNKRIIDRMCVGLLCKCGGDPRMANKNGVTVLELANSFGVHPEVLTTLEHAVEDLEMAEELAMAEAMKEAKVTGRSLTGLDVRGKLGHNRHHRAGYDPKADPNASKDDIVTRKSWRGYHADLKTGFSMNFWRSANVEARRNRREELEKAKHETDKILNRRPRV